MDGRITISRNSHDRVVVQLFDEAAAVRFAEFDMSLECFAQAVTGLARVEGILTVRDLHKVGKKCTVERRSVSAPHLGYQKEPYRQWLLANATEEGWEIDTYLGSQNSINHGEDGFVTLNYIVRKYESAPTGDQA